jgi:hypothetical protein
VEEAVLLEADVHKGRLEAGKDVVDLSLVDVAHDRAAAAPLDVELPYPLVSSKAGRLRARTAAAPAASALVARSGLVLLGRCTAWRGLTLRLQDCDPRFATVDRDDHSLSQKCLS